MNISKSFAKGVVIGFAAGLVLTLASYIVSGYVYADTVAVNTGIDISTSSKNGFEKKVEKMVKDTAIERNKRKRDIENQERDALHAEHEAEKERYLKEQEEAEEEYAYEEIPSETYVYEDERTMIRRYCAIYGVSSPLATAISRLETGNWTSNGYLNCNNWGGMMGSNGLMVFSTREEGCEAFINLLKWYADNGMPTADTMGPVYCPDGDGHWVSLVGQLMFEELVG